MSLVLEYHPLSSYCHKALIALYENDTPFSPHLVDLGNEIEAAAFKKIWPIGKFPVLRDSDRNEIVPESSIIIEYLAQHYPGKSALIPVDADLARDARKWDRFFDFYLNDQVGKIVTDRLRPLGKGDPLGVENAKSVIRTALEMADKEMATKTWVVGDAFSIADCAAAPALFYTNLLLPFTESHRHLDAYLGRLLERSSFARVVKEAKPFLGLMPK